MSPISISSVGLSPALSASSLIVLACSSKILISASKIVTVSLSLISLSSSSLIVASLSVVKVVQASEQLLEFIVEFGFKKAKQVECTIAYRHNPPLESVVPCAPTVELLDSLLKVVSVPSNKDFAIFVLSSLNHIVN